LSLLIPRNLNLQMIWLTGYVTILSQYYVVTYFVYYTCINEFLYITLYNFLTLLT